MSAVYQFYLNKTGRKKKTGKKEYTVFKYFRGAFIIYAN